MQPWLRNDLEQDPRHGKRVLAAVLLSVALHLILILSRLSVPNAAKPMDNQPIEVVQVPPDYMDPAKNRIKVNPKEQRMAETEDAKKEEDPNARFLSDRNQKAEKETKAKAIDDFRKKQGSGSMSLSPEEMANIPPTGDDAKNNGEKNPEPKSLAEGEGDMPKAGDTGKKAGVKRDWKTLSLKDLSVGGDGGATAATDDKLDDVTTGDRTILSTREFRYFSYYHRIKELLRQYWKPKVEQKLYSLWAKGRTVGEEELVTKVMVLLDNTGKIQKISRIGSSGINELDDAAIESFQKAAPFPNPPKGIVDADGFVRIRWDFILKTEAAPRIQFATPGGQRQAPY